MYEKILQKLKTQRGQTSNVSDRSLEDLAKALESLIASDEILEKTDLTTAIGSIDQNINHYTAEEVKKLKVPGTNPVPVVPPVKKIESTNDMPEWAKALLEPIKLLSEKVGKIEGEKTGATRKEKLSEKLKETPDLFKSAMLKSFERQTFIDEADFNTYLTEIAEQSKTAIQEGKEKGLVFSSPGANVHQIDPEGVSPEMAQAIKDRTEVKNIKNPF